MADDNIVTDGENEDAKDDQVVEGDDKEVVEETPEDESMEFDSDDDLDESVDGLKSEDKKKSEKDSKEDKKVAPDKDESDKGVKEGLGDDDSEDGDDDKDGDGDDDDSDETDEDIVRGKKVLEEKEKVDSEAKKVSDAKKEAKDDSGAYNPSEEKNELKNLEFMKTVIPKNLFPDEAELSDGTKLDFKAIFMNEPEIPLMVAVIANNLIKQMVHNGFLVTSEDITGVNQKFNDKLFVRTVTSKTHGVPSAREINKDPEFHKWLEAEPKEVQALRGSENPDDHVRLFKRYLNSSGLDDAKKKVVDIDKNRREKKEKFDNIHKSTLKSGKKRSKKNAMSPQDEEAAGFNSKDDDDD